jgi:hypothetical protein
VIQNQADGNDQPDESLGVWLANGAVDPNGGGKPVALVLSNVEDEQMVTEPGKPNRPALIHRRLIAVLSFAKAGQ